MGRLRNAWKALFGDEGAPQSAGGLLSGIFQSGEPARRNTRELLLAYKRLPFLRSAAHKIANDVAGVPLKVYRAKRGRSSAKSDVRTAAGDMRRKLVDDYSKAGELEAVESHPFLDLMATWNPATGGHAARVVAQLYVDIKGELFAVKERNALGQTLELWPVPPHWIAETPSVPRPFFRASWSGWQREFPESEVLWARSPDPENPYGRGTGIVEALADELDIDEFAAKQLKGWFKNRAMPDFLVALEGIGEADAKRVQKMFEQEYRGPERAGRTHVHSAKMSVESLTHSLKDQDMAALRAAQRDTVIHVFNIPPECMGIIENSNRATIDSADYLYAKGVLCPRMDFWVSNLQPLLDEYDDGLVLGYASPVQEDKEYKKQVFAQAPQGVFSKNEYRALAGMPPVEDGDEEKEEAQLFQYHLTFGIVTINEARARLGLPPIAGGDKPPDPFLLLGGGAGAPGEEMRAEPPWAKSLAALGGRRKTSQSDIEGVLENLRPDRLVNEVRPLWEEQVRRWGERALAEVGVGGSFDMRNPLIRDHIEEFAGRKIGGLVHESTREELRATLGEGVAAGEGVDKLRERVMSVFDNADKARAERIARTEVVGSSNLANLSAFEQSGVVPQKEWLSVRDGNTRDSHKALDGQTVAVRSAFTTPTGQQAQHPGGFGDPEMDINCRCSVLPVVEAPGKSAAKMSEEEKAAAWKRYDKRLGPWEASAMAALRRGFRKQEQDILAALDELAR